MKDYFSHDYNSRNDKKLVRAFMRCGLESIGAYWCIVEMLYEEGGYLSLSEYERIIFELRSTNDTINYLIYESELFKNDGVKFWSESGIERLKLRSEKSEKARKSIESRWNRENNTNVLRTNENSNTIKVKESKEKVKEKVEVKEIPTLKDFLDYAKLNDSEFDLRKSGIELKYKSWVENGWKDGNGNKIKNWKSKILNTISFIPVDKNKKPDQTRGSRGILA